MGCTGHQSCNLIAFDICNRRRTFRCRRRTLDKVRTDLMPYKPRPVTFQAGLGHLRSGSVVDLRLLVEQRIRIAEAMGIAKVSGPAVKVVISVDATHMWHQSATRCDVFVDVQGEGHWAGLPRMWSTWFTFDGPDDCGPLRVADEKGGLNAMVAELQGRGVVVCGQRYPVLCFLTGDGKGMKATHHREGSRCWHCDLQYNNFGGGNLQPCPNFQETVRWGAFLRDIPPNRRIGDMAHAACRVTGCVLKRLMDDERVTAHPHLVRQIQTFILGVNQDAAKIPSDTRLAPQRNTGVLDITSSQVFIGTSSKRPLQLAQLCKEDLGVVRVGTHGSFDVLVLRLLMALQHMNRCWRAKEGLGGEGGGGETVAGYRKAVEQFVDVFVALGWQPAVWLHWVGVHSVAVATAWKNFYLFSSIPKERRHQEYKLDIRHSCQAWKRSSPHLSTRGLLHAHAMDCLDQGLLQWAAGRPLKRKRGGLGRRRRR